MSREWKPITTVGLFNETTITKNTSLLSMVVDLRDIAQDGIFSVEYIVSGDGTVKIEYNVCSTREGLFFEPSSASDIASGLTKTSGPGSDGHDFKSFGPELTSFLKIKVTETGTVSDAIITLDLNIQ